MDDFFGGGGGGGGGEVLGGRPPPFFGKGACSPTFLNPSLPCFRHGSCLSTDKLGSLAPTCTLG